MGSACSSANTAIVNIVNIDVDIPREIEQVTHDAKEAINGAVQHVNDTAHAFLDSGGNAEHENDHGDQIPVQDVPDNEDADDESSEPNAKEDSIMSHTHIVTPSAPSHKYKLVALGGERLWSEPARLILHYAEVSFHDELINEDQFHHMKDQGQVPSEFELPLIYMGGELKGHSMEACRFLANELGKEKDIEDLSSEDEEETAKMDLLMSGWAEVASDVGTALTEAMDEDKEATWAGLKTDKVMPFLNRYTQFLEANQGAWFVGNQVSWVDLTIADFIGTLVSQHDSGLLANHMKLLKHMEAIQAIPNIAKHYSHRPDCPI